jgi:unsaturated pyranuronate lyase
MTATGKHPQHFSFDKLPPKPMNELLTRRMISGESGTIGYFVYKKGAVVPLHHHSNEQYALIIQGSVNVYIDDQVYLVKAGEGIIIPPDVPHKFVALEDDTIDIDFFTPPRQDWLSGTDNYFSEQK